MIRLGLFFYDHLARRGQLPKSCKLNLADTIHGKPLKDSYQTGFSYYDCQTDDSRLVIANAKFADRFNANILTRHECIKLTNNQQSWHAILKNQSNHQYLGLNCKAVINAAGPWVADVIKNCSKFTCKHHLKFIKGRPHYY